MSVSSGTFSADSDRFACRNSWCTSATLLSTRRSHGILNQRMRNTSGAPAAVTAAVLAVKPSSASVVARGSHFS